MSNFTPGPWKVGWPMGNGERLITTKDGVPIAVASNGWMILTGNVDVPTIENSYLIAAAPILYAALLECHEAMEYMSEYDIPIGLPGRVSAALKKARGGS